MNGLAMYGMIILVFGLVFWRRTRAMVRPIKGSGIRILMPLMIFLPGISVFMSLQLQLKTWEIAVAALAGLLLAIPLMWTTNYEIREDGQIYAQKNKSFFIALIFVLVIRMVFKQFISGLDPASLGMLFFAVAISYVVPWRIVSFIKFRKVKQSQSFLAATPVKA
ncbi:CcdC protein domain-containing protein [Neobacillus dielmonensis]|uniref:CcdC protein domain-containing protein n=1 Tax=Neobacillus dielmonensis TaxID=1347369 RepID=UPI0005AB1FB5|nr:CcdC protein domain-containing protein [Neobacillus dielmonensis]